MANQWYVQHGGKEHGPFTSANLKRLADEGKITPTTPVRPGTASDWVAASRIQGLFAAAPSTAPASVVAAPKPAARVVTPPPPPPRADPLARPRVSAVLPQAVPVAQPAIGAKILGAIGLVLGILALATFWLPYLGGPIGWIGIGAGGLGVLLGIAGLAWSTRNHGSGLALGIAGSSSSLVGLVLTLVMGSQFGLFGEAPRPIVKLPVEVATVAPPVAQPEPPVEEPKPEPPPEPVWTDASQAIELPGLTARVSWTKIENIRLENADLSTMKRPKAQPMLKIHVELTNTSTDKIIPFVGWTGGAELVGQGVGALLGAEAGKALQSATATAALSDNAGNRYKQVSALQLNPAAAISVSQDNSIRPGQTSGSDLVFPPPLATIEYLRIELPGAAFDGDEPLRFQIPRDLIGGMPPPPGN